jgi:hypothetical protein
MAKQDDNYARAIAGLDAALAYAKTVHGCAFPVTLIERAYKLMQIIQRAEPERNRVVHCIRCGETGESIGEEFPVVPTGWESTVDKPVCPNCQFTEWHPHCMALLDWKTDEVVDPEVDWADMPPEERDYDSVRYCEFIDLTVSYLDEDLLLATDEDYRWQCPECGAEHRIQQDENARSTFEFVHRDYIPGGLRGAGFEVVESDEDENDEDEQ